MADITFGQIYPVDSVIHRLDARAKLLLTIAYTVMIFLVNTIVVYAVIAALLLVVILLSRVPLRIVLRSVRGIIVLLAFTLLLTVLLNKGLGEQAELERYGFFWQYGIFTICGSGLISGGTLMLRLLLVVIGTSMLTFTTTPVALTDAIESLLLPLRLIKIPTHAFCMIMSIALRLIPTIMGYTQRIINAQKARGAAFDHGNIFKRVAALLPILLPLFVSSMRMGDELADAMDSRCYSGAVGRTRRVKLRFAVRDLVAFVLFAAFFFFVLMLTFNWWGMAWIKEMVVV